MNSTVVSERFLLSPMPLNITVDTVAVFQCQHTTADGINWRINGSTLRDLPQTVSTDRTSDGIFTLTITAHSNYNQTVIECVALFADSPSERTNQASLIVQGKYVIVYVCHLDIEVTIRIYMI